MSTLMRCPYCGLLQDEPAGAKSCVRCGGGLEYEKALPPGQETYVQVQMELDQVAAPSNQNVERYLLVTIRTPLQVPLEEAAPVNSSRPTLNFSAVLDVSGSMQGEKIKQAKDAVRLALHSLHTGDIFSLVTFSNAVECPFEPAPIDSQSLPVLEQVLAQVNAGGMTALDGGLEKGLANALAHSQENNLALLLSDGQANVGQTDLEIIGQRAFQARQRGVIVSTLGVGLDYNEALMAEIATQGGGRFYHVQHASQVPAYLASELGEVIALAAKNVKIQLNIPAGATLVPLSSAYPVQQAGDQASISVGDIPCDTELEIPLRLALLGQPGGSKLSIEGVLTFRSPAGHNHTRPINRVTIRFTPQEQFHLREGVVTPVVERVLNQMRAVHVLDSARTLARQPDLAEKQADLLVHSLRSYAELLGEERAEEEAQCVEERLMSLHLDQTAAKDSVADAYIALRGMKFQPKLKISPFSKSRNVPHAKDE